MSFVITCGDEGVQINEGTRLGILGAGLQLSGFDKIVAELKKILEGDLRIAASGENDFTKQLFDLTTWEQADASMQQHVQALADQYGLSYAGFLPFADPQELEFGIKGHMVRPHAIHIGNSICFTLDGGELKYHLGQYLISAEWLNGVDREVARVALAQQISFYKEKLAGGRELKFTAQRGGALGAAVADANLAILSELGYEPEVKDFSVVGV